MAARAQPTETPPKGHVGAVTRGRTLKNPNRKQKIPAAGQRPLSKVPRILARVTLKASKALPRQTAVTDMSRTPDDDQEPTEITSPPPRSFSEMVRENPLGALIGAFLVGMLFSRFLRPKDA
jgi:hypothetical protein